MSVFRASGRTTSPDGRVWEIYAYKIRLRPAEPWRTGFADDAPPHALARAEFAVVDLLVWLVLLVPRLLVRLGEAAVACARSVVSDTWWVEAVTFVPQDQSYVWRTTHEHKGQVLAQVEGSLARGEVPQHLRHATYEGWRRSAR